MQPALRERGLEQREKVLIDDGVHAQRPQVDVDLRDLLQSYGVRSPALDLVGDCLRARREVGFTDGLNRQHERGEVIVGIRRGERANYEIDVRADVEVLRHDADISGRGADSLLAQPVQRTWANRERLFARGAEHDHRQQGAVQRLVHDRLPVEMRYGHSDVRAFAEAVKRPSRRYSWRRVVPVRGSISRTPRRIIRRNWML